MNEREPRRRTGLNLWLVLAVLPIFSFTCWFCLQEDDSVAPPPPSVMTPGDVVLPEPLPTPRVESVDAGAAAGLDVGAPDAGVDAGVTRAREPSEAEIAAYVAKWKAALAPVLRNSRPEEPKLLTSGADGGVALDAGTPCQPGEQRLAFTTQAPLDIVVVVDSSGSMFTAGLDIAADFLGRLEFDLLRAGRDFRLLVLAEPRVLKLTIDGGVLAARVQSHDGLDVLLDTATLAQPRWFDVVRPSSELHLLLITDDGPSFRATSEGFLAKFRQLPRPPASFSVLGGFGQPEFMTRDDPSLAQGVCSSNFKGRTMHGLDPGVVYQEVSMALGGYRASICSELGRGALQGFYVGAGAPRTRCEWALPRNAEVFELRAMTPTGGRYLMRERIGQCRNLQRSFVFAPPLLTLCPETCTDLLTHGTDSLVVRVSCQN
ncbi:MAG: VWA domain-containing protein [Archangium sp.]|nr:VWA domain-containing protein [Archangium sp.]